MGRAPTGGTPSPQQRRAVVLNHYMQRRRQTQHQEGPQRIAQLGKRCHPKWLWNKEQIFWAFTSPQLTLS
eukprot:11456628-Ditylum_brightwellii.AAC.1